MFSLEQVRDIVQRTVDERERVMRAHYDRVLQQKLQGACSTPHIPCPYPCPSAPRADRRVSPRAYLSAQSNGSRLPNLTRTTCLDRSSPAT